MKIFIVEATSGIWFNLFEETLQRNTLVREQNQLLYAL